MCAGVPGHIVHCGEFIWGIYTDSAVSYLCMCILHMLHLRGMLVQWHMSNICIVIEEGILGMHACTHIYTDIYRPMLIN